MNDWGFPSFGAYFRHLRQTRNLSRMDVAQKIDGNQSYFSYLESGKRWPSRSLIERMAQSIDLTMAEVGGLWLTAGLLPPSKDVLEAGIAYLEFNLNGKADD